MNMTEILHLAFLFWIILDSVGNVPIFVSLLKYYEPARQRRIIMRELLIALFFMIIFLFFGHGFFTLLNVSPQSLQLAGGIILFIIAMRMILSGPKKELSGPPPKEPLIVPLAVPAVSGPGILATIILYSGAENSKLGVFIAILIAWLLSIPPLLFAPSIKAWIGENGTVTIERLFGYIIVLIAVQMALEGIKTAF